MKDLRNIRKELQKIPSVRLDLNIRTADEVYAAALYGARYNEAQLIHILSLSGLKSFKQKLNAEKYTEAIKVINALNKDIKKINFEISDKEIPFLRRAIKHSLKLAIRIPHMAREQLLITYALLTESYINDTFREYFKRFPRSLKSNKFTLKDNQIIESIIENNTLEKLIDTRVKEIMFSSITGWSNYLSQIGMKIIIDKKLKEMYLVRNALIHNGKKVSQELSSSIGGPRYKIGNNINVTENDIVKYRKSIEELAKQINSELRIKYRKNLHQ